MLDVEQREATRQFIMKWTGKGKEDEGLGKSLLFP